MSEEERNRRIEELLEAYRVTDNQKFKARADALKRDKTKG
jgi:hypothetical protein